MNVERRIQMLSLRDDRLIYTSLFVPVWPVTNGAHQVGIGLTLAAAREPPSFRDDRLFVLPSECEKHSPIVLGYSTNSEKGLP